MSSIRNADRKRRRKAAKHWESRRPADGAGKTKTRSFPKMLIWLWGENILDKPSQWKASEKPNLSFMLRVCNEIATASLEFEQKQFSNCNARAVCGVNSRRNRVLSVAGCCWGTAESRSLPADRLGQFSFLQSIWSPAAQCWSHGARLSSAHISQFLAWDLKLSTQPLRASPEAIGHSFYQFFI